jgi:sugar phosphate isomerase/epimerase
MAKKKTKVKILASITDFPLFRTFEYNFFEIKKTGADGVEIVHGIKSHWPFEKVKKLSQKYHLPVLSVHQPLWGGYGFPDFSFVKFALDLNVENIVIHPLPRLGLEDEKMKRYFEKMSKLGQQYGFKMLLENLPVKSQAPFVDKFFPGHQETFNPLLILEAAKKWGFKITLDTTHLEDGNIDKRPWLKKVLLHTENIHLSNFSPKRAHYPIYMGNMDYKNFLSVLKDTDYERLITLEIYYPKMAPLRNYDYSGLKKSIEIIRKELNI